MEPVSKVWLGLNLDLKNCVGISIDGAENNMQWCYKGFSTLLSKKAPMQVHVWRHPNELNLVVSEATSVVLTSASLFSLLNETAVFYWDLISE